MAAYAALVSVMQILHQIKNHPFPPISLNKQQVESFTEIVTFLQEFLEGYNSPAADTDEADPLEMRIADAAYAAEDLIESNIVNNIKLVPETTDDAESNIVDRIIPSGSESQKEPKNDGEEINSVDLCEGLKKVIEDMNLIKKDVMDIVAEKEVAQDQLQRQVSSASENKLSSLNNTMVGFDDVCLEIMDKLTDGRLNRQVIPIVGMGGIDSRLQLKNRRLVATPF